MCARRSAILNSQFLIMTCQRGLAAKLDFGIPFFVKRCYTEQNDSGGFLWTFCLFQNKIW